MKVLSAAKPVCAHTQTSVRRMVVVALPVLFSGCATTSLTSHVVPASASAVLASPVVSVQKQHLDRQQMQYAEAKPSAYRLGPGDAIAVSVYMHPELSTPQPGVTTSDGGALITSDGTVGLPLIGDVKLGGLTLRQAQDRLTADYGNDINNANVTVQLVTAHSLRYYLLGDFSQPGVKYPGRELTLLEALSLGGSLNVGNADLYQAYVAQDGRKVPVDIRGLLLDGDLSQNIVLRPGATVVVPPASDEKAYVFGSVGKPGAVDFEGGRLTLLQALSAADMDLANYSAARLSQVRVIRAQGAGADFIVVDAEKILHGEAAPFGLEPGDIVFIPPTEVASWNQVLDMVLPSLNTVSGVLNPFVSIKYLSQKN
jgi:polysaccharide export outer membrane protein